MSAAAQLSGFIKFNLEVVQGPHTGQRFSFDKKSAFIGRGPENEIVLSEDPRISRQHAEIKQMDGQFYIINLSQKNFILVNGEKAETEKIKNGDLLQIGESELKFMAELKLTVATPAVAPMVSPVAPATATPAVSPKVQSPVNSQSTSYLQTMVGPIASKSAPQGRPQVSVKSQSPQDSSQIRFYVIITVIGIILYFIFSDPGKSKKKENEIRSSVKVEEDLQEATESLNAIKERNLRLDDKTYVRAQENYLKGFREYRQGNYLRARDYFQIVISLDPDNEQAKTYLRLSRIKYDELVQYNMLQGLRYREKKNYRMCKSSFSNVLTLIQNNKSHPSFKQADLFFEECSQALKGRY